MQIVAFFLAVCALLVFLAVQLEVPKKWAKEALGLAFLTAALMVQYVVQTGPFFKVK